MSAGAIPNFGGVALPPTTGNSMTQFLQSLQSALTTSGSQAFGTGQTAFGAGLQDFQPAQQYWQDILSGNKSEMESAIAPEKSSILDQYRAKRRSRAQLASRSGGTNEAETAAGYSEAGDVSKLLQTLRPQAAKESSDIAGKIASLGLSESGIGNEQIFQALSAALTQRSQNFGQQSNEFGLASTLIGALV
jgi:hypothetical protein